MSVIEIQKVVFSLGPDIRLYPRHLHSLLESFFSLGAAALSDLVSAPHMAIRSRPPETLPSVTSSRLFPAWLSSL